MDTDKKINSKIEKPDKEKSQTANIKLTIQYDGTKYSGWQKQGNTDNTIQEKFERILSEIFGEDIEINGSGRTDAGVHALGQVANFKTKAEVELENLVTMLNEKLPQDIKVLSAEKEDPRFHARLSSREKHYRYVIDNSGKADVFLRKYVAEINGDLDISRMRKAAEYMTGTKDFKSFCGNKHMKKSTVRTVKAIIIHKEDNVITLDFYGDGFLYNMVRIMTGTLILAGQGNISPEDVEKIIEAKDRDKAGFLASAKGLSLVEVFY